MGRRNGSRRAALGLAVAVLLGATEATPARAQTDPTHEGSFWLGYLSDWEIRGPWSVAFDTHYNWETFYVLRAGLAYRWEAGPSLTGGYAYVRTDPGDGTLRRDEHRPWGQVYLPFRFSDRWSISQRLRFELRVREKVDMGAVVDGWEVEQRWRFQTAVNYWLATRPRGQGFLQASDEVLFDVGQNAGPNYLDQNRISLLFGWKVREYTVRVGYMDRFVPGSTGLAPMHQHIAIFWFNQVIRLHLAPDEAGPHPDSEERNP